jgi:hypothetical protein
MESETQSVTVLPSPVADYISPKRPTAPVHPHRHNIEIASAVCNTALVQVDLPRAALTNASPIDQNASTGTPITKPKYNISVTITYTTFLVGHNLTIQTQHQKTITMVAAMVWSRHRSQARSIRNRILLTTVLTYHQSL